MASEFQTRNRAVVMKDGSTSSVSVSAFDGLANMMTGMGGGSDSIRAAFYTNADIAQTQLDNAYQTSAYTRKIVTIPATDSVRAWRKWSAEDSEITAIEAEEKRLGLQGKIRRAEIISRLYGGAAILMGTVDGNLSQPLDVNRVGKGALRYLHVVSRYRITIPNLILDPGSEFFMQPSMYQINGGDGRIIDVHPSRISRFVNGDLPDDILERNQGWGDSTLKALWSTIIHSDTAQSTFAALLPKALLDTVYVPGLTSIVSTTEGEENVKRRFVVAKMFESVFGVKLMESSASGNDGPSERWETRQIAWNGIPEIMTAFMQWLAGAADIPMTRFAGMSPGGLQSTGDSDERNYFQMVSAGQELNIRPRLDPIDQILVRSALGAYPNNVSWSFNPLYVDSDATKAETALKRATALEKIKASETVPPEVLQEAVKNQLIESGEYPGIEQAYDDYSAGNLDSLIEEPEEAPADPLIPVDPLTGMPTQNRESRLFAANDIASRLLADGATTLEAITEAHRLTDATPRPLYVSRAVLNRDELQTWATKQGLGELQPDLHVTILYSRDAVDWLRMGTTWADRDGDGSGRLLVNAGGPRVVEPLGDRTAVLQFANTDIQWRHEEMVRAGASHDYPDFIPHISLTQAPVNLTKVKPYTGKIELGPEIFAVLEE